MSKISVRDLIVNALDESKLCSRTQPAPANLMVTGLQLLQKRAAQYSNTSLLQFTRKEINIDLTKHEFIIGEYELTEDFENLVIFINDSETINDLDPSDVTYRDKIVCAKDTNMCYEARLVDDAYTWVSIGDARELADVFEMVPDYEVYNLQEVTQAYIQARSTQSDIWNELNFIAYEDFYQYDITNQIYSVLPLTDKCAKIILKKTFALHQFRLKLMFTVAFNFDIDTVFNIPKQFVALFSTALVYDLSVAYPRLSEASVAKLETRLEQLERNVRRSSSMNKFVGRNPVQATCTYADFINGRFLGI